MPAKTSVGVFDQVLSLLVCLCVSNCEVFSPNWFAPLAGAIQTLVNGVVCIWLPSCRRWINTYSNDTELCSVRELVLHLSLISNKHLLEVNHNYCGPFRLSQISVKYKLLILKEPICGGVSYTPLLISPKRAIQHLICCLPHKRHRRATKPIPDTSLHLTPLFWPGMFSYTRRMCQACLGCTLSNPNCGR